MILNVNLAYTLHHFSLKLFYFVLFCNVYKLGYIEISISGSKGNLELSPDNYDIREIISILENINADNWLTEIRGGYDA